MSNDLIHRSALKKAIIEATYDFEQIPIRVDKVQEIIDNIPTVEPDEIQAIMKDYLVYRCEWKRPRGKWVYRNDNFLIPTGYWECSECGIGKQLVESNFCPYCGSDMRSDNNEKGYCNTCKNNDGYPSSDICQGCKDFDRYVRGSDNG